MSSIALANQIVQVSTEAKTKPDHHRFDHDVGRHEHAPGRQIARQPERDVGNGAGWADVAASGDAGAAVGVVAAGAAAAGAVGTAGCVCAKAKAGSIRPISEQAG